MHVTSWFAVALLIALVMPAFAQDWELFVFADDGFSVNFPGRPRVESATWVTQYRYTLPARIYTASRGAERYSATVVDYRGIEAQGVARGKACPPEAETCAGTQDGRQGAIIGPGYWKMDVRGALAHATLKFLQRDVEVTDFNLQFQDVVEGYLLNLTNRDGSRTMAYVTMHENRLYLFEGTTPKGYAEPALFQGSIGFVDAEGRSIRYLNWYSNAVHGLGQYERPPYLSAQPPGAAPALPGAPRR
jgi:hypothetical protein